MTAPRFLFVSHDGNLGGAQLSLADTCAALVGAGAEVHATVPPAPEEGPLAATLRALGAQVHAAPPGLWAAPPGKGLFSRHLASLPGLVPDARALREVMLAVAPNLVVSNTALVAGGCLAARSRGIPHVWQLHERQVREDPLRFLVPLRVVRALMRRGNVVVPSESLADECRGWMPSSRVRVLTPHVGVATTLTGSQVAERAAVRPTCLLFPGGLLPVKRPLEALAGLANVRQVWPELTLDIVGWGWDTWQTREAEAVRAQPGASWLGFQDDLPSRLTPGTILLSCGVDETFGRVLVEAMAAGVPVVAAAAGATPEIVRDGATGLLYPPGHVGALAGAVLTLRDDDALRRRLLLAAHRDASSRWGAPPHAAAWLSLAAELSGQALSH